MTIQPELVPERDKLLFTPGPLTTSATVKQAMLHDAGSWHHEFTAIVTDIRDRLLHVAGLSRASGWEAVLLQGSGTFGVEAVFQTCVPPNGKVVVLANGAYGERMAQMLSTARIDHVVIRAPEDAPVDPDSLDARLANDPEVTHVAVVHCETTTGILNPVDRVGQIAHRHGKAYIVDAMSSFAGIPIDLERDNVDFLISSSNKCIEGVPGFCFVICRRSALLACEGYARSLSLDLLTQLRGFESNGQFRYTPPTHALLAFQQALNELDAEGGIAGRNTRYQENHATLLRGMTRLGFTPYLAPSVQSCIIAAFRYPRDGFDFTAFYNALAERGFIIYPGKLTKGDTFRIGNIGRLFPEDIEHLVSAVGAVWRDMRDAPRSARAPLSNATPLRDDRGAPTLAR
jgi:2-aminoethylphosphonate-pyruvate transaminase